MNKVFIVCAGGYGMSSLAMLYLDLGWQVSGCDAVDSSRVRILRGRGALIHIGHRPENLGFPDMVVYSTAASHDTPELAAAREKNILCLHRTEALAGLLQGRCVAGITGTHGKTTTTTMTAYLMERLGMNPGYYIGGYSPDLKRNACIGTGPMAVEVDESDGSLRRIKADIAVVTNLELEHVDYYNSEDDLIGAVTPFVLDTPEYVIMNKDCPLSSRLMKAFSGNSAKKVRTFSMKEDSAYTSLLRWEFDDKGVTAVSTVGTETVSFSLPFPGKHNIENALAALTVISVMGTDPGKAAGFLESMSLPVRRFTLRAAVGTTVFYDDYAHHPTEVKAVLSGARQRGSRVVAVFQPHRHTRFTKFWREFGEALEEADVAVITDIYSAGEKPSDDDATPHDLIHSMNGVAEKHYITSSNLAHETARCIREGDCVVVLGAGDITRKIDDIIRAYRTM